MSKTVAFHTLGCRLNISESGSIADEFSKRGYQVVEFGNRADVTFINTCTVTDKADSTCRNLIRKAKKFSPESKVIVAGCYAQMSPHEIAKMDVDLILGTSEKFKVLEYLDQEEERLIRIDKSNEFWGASTTLSDESHTRAFLKIQDGCNYICSYCIIPFARGRSRTITIQEASIEAQKLIQQGFKEIILTGVNIGEYEDHRGEKLSNLLYELLNLKGLERLRLSSVEPNTIDDELLHILKDAPHFMPHFHIPLQSGSDEILKAMKRKYDVSFYQEVLAKVITHFPMAGIGGDVIAGFPGESDEQFSETIRLIENSPLTHIHAFPFSKRKGTVAAKMEGQVPESIKKERVAKLNDLRAKKLKDFSLQNIGTIQDVLFESPRGDGYFEGHTPNFIKVKVHGEGKDLHNQIVKILVKGYCEQEEILEGQIISCDSI